MSALDAAANVLGAAGTPLRVDEITARVVADGQWVSKGKTPAATIEAQLAMEIKKHGKASRFVRTAPRTYGVRDWPKQALVLPASPETHSFTDAAEAILAAADTREPMHYRQLTERALAAGMLSTKGLTPHQTMYSQLITEMARRTRRGEDQRFARYPEGLFGLARWAKPGLEGQIARHNREVRRRLHERLRSMDPVAFESLIGELLDALGFTDVIVTRRSGDGGIDVRAVLVVGDVIRTEMAVQVKRWKANVQAPVVQGVRGSLGAHDRGLIVTTGEFSPGARAEAARPNAAPVALMNGEELVALLVEHEIGVRRAPQELLELTESRDAS
jgi:restriction system protein